MPNRLGSAGFFRQPTMQFDAETEARHIEEHAANPVSRPVKTENLQT